MRNALLLPLLAAISASPLASSASAQVPFTVRIENVSTGATLKSASGQTAPAPNSPGLWIVQTKPSRLFQVGKQDMGWGLETQAEDGSPAKLAEHYSNASGVLASGVFNTPVGDDKPGPALPGKAYQFTFTAKPGDRLSFTSMFGQSNDLFFAPDEKGIALFENGRPVSGDLTSQIHLWDAGTEVNEEPGFGPNQAPRQAMPNTGRSEHKPVGHPRDAFHYPKVAEVIRVTITPAQTASR